MEYALGIDLGTSYSAAATAREGRVEIFQLGERAATIPSVVFVRADGEVLTGDAAERRSLAEPTRTAREFKRRLGDPTPIIIGGTPYSAEALMAHQLRAIVGRVTEELGEPPAAIVVTHPASYGAYKIDLLEQAIRQAGIANATLLSEPEAAAVQYARQERVPAGAVVAVYDFGGGTFEATILRRTEDGFEQLGRPETIDQLGGIDFDEAIFNRVMTMVRSSGVVVDLEDPATLAAIARLREECRRAKEALSFDTDANCRRHPARLADRHPADPRGIRGHDQAADHRDDLGARAGGEGRRYRFRRGRPDPARRWNVADPARRRDGPRGDRATGGGRCSSEALDLRSGLRTWPRPGGWLDQVSAAAAATRDRRGGYRRRRGRCRPPECPLIDRGGPQATASCCQLAAARRGAVQ